jgi:hypothetical protein
VGGGARAQLCPARRGRGERAGKRARETLMMFDRSGRVAPILLAFTSPGAPVEREEGKGGCEINLSELSGLETQCEF